MTDNRNLQVRLLLTADGAELQGELRDAEGNVRRFGSEGAEAGRKTERGMQRAERATRDQRRETDRAASSLDRMGRRAAQAAAALLTIQGARQLAEIADTATLAEARLASATGSLAQGAEAFETAIEIAERARAPLDDTARLFFRLTQATQDLPNNIELAEEVTTRFLQTLLIGGATIEEQRSAIIQFSQAIASDVLGGEELRSLRESAPRAIQALVDSLDVGIGKLRDMGAAGELTRDRLIAAFRGELGDEIAKEVADIPLTVGQAMTLAGNALMVYVDDLNEAFDVTDKVAGAIKLLAINLDVLAEVITATVVIAIGRYTAGKLAAQGVTLANVRALYAEIAALNASERAIVGAVASTRALTLAKRGLLAVIGGPAGLVITLGTLAFLFREELGESLDMTREKFEELIGPGEDVRDVVRELSEGLRDIEPGEGLTSVRSEVKALREEAERLAEILAEQRAQRDQRVVQQTRINPLGGPQEVDDRIRATEDRLQVVTEQLRLAQHLSGERQFEDLTLLLEGVGRAADFAAPLIARFTGEVEQAAATDDFANALTEQIDKLRLQVIELTAGEQAAQDYKDALLLAAAAEQDAEDDTTANTEAVRRQIAERERLEGAIEAQNQAEERAAARAERVAKAQDAAYEALQRIVETYEESAEASREFEAENRRLAAELQGPSAEAAYDYSLAIRRALELLAEGDITVDQFRERVRLLREELEGGAAAAEGGMGLDSLAGRLSRSIIEGANITDAIGRSLSSYGGEQIAGELEIVFQDAFNAAMETLPLSDEAKDNLSDAGAGIALGIGQIISGEVEQGIGTALGGIIGSFTPLGGALGAAAGGLLGSLFGGGKVPKFQVSGANTAAGRDIGPNNQDRLDTAIGEFYLGLRKLDAETEDAVANALVGVAASIAGVVRDTDLLAEIERQIADTRFSSRSDGESTQRLVAEVFDNVLNALDAGVAAFVRRGDNLEERLARFEAAFAVSRRLVGRRGLGLTGEGFEPITDPIGPPGGGGGGGGGGGIVDPGGPVRRIQASEMREFGAVVQGVGDAASLSNPALLQTLDLLDELQIGSESLVKTFDRLVAVTNLLDEVVALTGNQVGATREEMVRFGADLVAFFGDSAEALGQQLGVIFDRFFSDEERLAAQADSSRARFEALLGDLGIDLTDTLLTEGGFRELFDALSGQLSPEDLAILIEAGVALDSLLDAEEALAEARGDSTESMRDAAAVAELLAGLELDAARRGLEGLDLALFNINQRFDELREQLIANGAAASELSELEARRDQAIRDAERDAAAAVAELLAGLELDAARRGLEGLDLALFNINQRFDELREQLIANGAAAGELAALESRRADAILAAERDQLESVLSQIFDGTETPLAALNRRFEEAAAAIAGVEGAEMALMAIRFEHQQALTALAGQLRASLVESIDQLFGDTGESADRAARSVGSAADAMRDMSRVAESLRDTILRIQGAASTSTLGPTGRRDFLQEQFNAALASGDLEQANQIAPRLADAIREVGASSADADERIRDLLGALERAADQAEASGGGPPTSGQVGGIQQTTERIEQRALEQIQLAREIVSQIAQLADIEQASGIALAAELGVPLDRLVEILGVDLASISVEQVRILGQLAEDFNEPIAALEEALGISLGELSDATSLLNDGLERAINGLPPEIAGPLEDALRDVEESGDVSDLERVVGDLPPSFANELAPFLDGIDVVSEVDITNRMLLDQTNVIDTGFDRILREMRKEDSERRESDGGRSEDQRDGGGGGGRDELIDRPSARELIVDAANAARQAPPIPAPTRNPETASNLMTKEDAQAIRDAVRDVERAVKEGSRETATATERAARITASRTSRVT